LRQLQEQEPVFLIDLIERMTDHRIVLSESELSKCEINTQVFGNSESYPDVEIAGPDTQIYVEVKDASPVDMDQLKRYATLIGERSVHQGCVVPLVRYDPGEISIDRVVPPVRWSRMGAWLNDLESNDEVIDHQLAQFTWFMRGKGLLIEKVEWALVPGVQQLARLQAMGREVLESLGAHVSESHGRGYSGLQIFNPENNQMMYALRTRLDDPARLWFGVVDRYRPDEDPELWERVGDLTATGLHLPSEEVHFFERSTNSQMDCLRAFIEDCFEAVGYDPSG
jgi:hypothetical protein